MKRACSFDYSSDEEVDALLAQVLDDFERHLIANDDDDDSLLVDALDEFDDDRLLADALDTFEQQGGAIPGPLFAFEFTPIGQRRRWRNVVTGQTFRAMLHQLREPRPCEDLGYQLGKALQTAIDAELHRQGARPFDRVNFSMHAYGFDHAFQSVNFEVQAFLQRSLRLQTLLQMLAEKLNSNEDFDPDGDGGTNVHHLHAYPCSWSQETQPRSALYGS